MKFSREQTALAAELSARPDSVVNTTTLGIAILAVGIGIGWIFYELRPQEKEAGA